MHGRKLLRVTSLHEHVMVAYTAPMQKPSSQTNPSTSAIEVQIPDELEYFLAETAEDLEITPDELVQQAVGSYCREKLRRRYE